MLFSGSATALVTPFSEGNVDYAAMARLVNFQLSEGTNALVVCGTTGEPSTMTEKEQLETIRFVVEEVGGSVPVIAGAGGNDTGAVVEASKKIADTGADSILSVTPYYNKTTQAGLVKHYEVIADASPLPAIVYNVPGRTGLNLEPETMATIAKHPNIVGLKEANADITKIMETFQLVAGNVPIYSGNDDHVYPLLALGGQGVISVASNIIPGQMRELTAAYLQGDSGTSLQIQMRLLPLIKALFTEVNPIPIKAALAKMGYIEDELRLPLVPLSPEPRKALYKHMQTLGLY